MSKYRKKPHAIKERVTPLGKWVTEGRLSEGMGTIDLAIYLDACFPGEGWHNQGRISELELGRRKAPPIVILALQALFQKRGPCPPPPEE